MSDIILLSEAHGVSETFNDMHRVFDPISSEIRHLLDNVIQILENTFKIRGSLLVT